MGQQPPLRAALYCRVSTADQSCARQERDLATFAERSGYEVVGTYKETASGVKLDRAERKRVMALAQRREIDAVLVTELSRWGRLPRVPVGFPSAMPGSARSATSSSAMVIDAWVPGCAGRRHLNAEAGAA